MGTPVPAGFSRRVTLKLGVGLAGGLGVSWPLSREHTAAHEE